MSEAPRVLVIEGIGPAREWLRHHLHVLWPAAQLTELAPAAAEGMPDEFGGGVFDLVVLSLDERREAALEWLARYARRPGFPPVVTLAGGGDEALAVRAIKAGAEDYLPRERLRHAALVRALSQALASRRREAVPTRTPGGVPRGWRRLETLHSGEFSSVVLAEHEDSGERRVYKLLHGGGVDLDAGLLYARFLAEYQSIAGLDHPNVVRIHDIGVSDDQAWIAMEYLPGGTLAARIGRGLAPGEALAMARGIARGLLAVHGLGVLHRDLKPGNVMLRADGQPALIDFGLAKAMRSEQAITSPGMIFGTPWYMSPEQGHGAPMDERADGYSLGVMLFEMLTGERPFHARTPMALVYQHRNAPRPPLPPTLADYQPLVHRMMAADPAARFESTAHLLMALEAAA